MENGKIFEEVHKDGILLSRVYWDPKDTWKMFQEGEFDEKDNLVNGNQTGSAYGVSFIDIKVENGIGTG